MTLHIDEVQTDLQVQAEPTATPPEADPPWQELARLRQLQRQLRCDNARTSACGNED